jgi:sister-chromatid-cohesion protein PDS5
MIIFIVLHRNVLNKYLFSPRFEVVTAIVSTARKDFDLVAKNESLLNNVKERTLDKKFKIR